MNTLLVLSLPAKPVLRIDATEPGWFRVLQSVDSQFQSWECLQWFRSQSEAQDFIATASLPVPAVPAPVSYTSEEIELWQALCAAGREMAAQVFTERTGKPHDPAFLL